MRSSVHDAVAGDAVRVAAIAHQRLLYGGGRPEREHTEEQIVVLGNAQPLVEEAGLQQHVAAKHSSGREHEYRAVESAMQRRAIEVHDPGCDAGTPHAPVRRIVAQRRLAQLPVLVEGEPIAERRDGVGATLRGGGVPRQLLRFPQIVGVAERDPRRTRRMDPRVARA